MPKLKHLPIPAEKSKGDGKGRNGGTRFASGNGSNGKNGSGNGSNGRMAHLPSEESPETSKKQEKPPAGSPFPFDSFRRSLALGNSHMDDLAKTVQANYPSMPWKRKPGRPSDYDPKFCEMLKEHMAEGMSYQTFGPQVGVCVATLDNWARDYPEFLVAKREGRELELEWWERILQQGAQGLGPRVLVKESYGVGKDGEPFHHMEYGAAKINVGLVTFAMCNKFRELGWSNPQRVEHTGKDGKPIQTESRNLHMHAVGKLRIDQLVVLKDLLVSADEQARQESETDRGEQP